MFRLAGFKFCPLRPGEEGQGSKNHLFGKADEKSPESVRDREERWAQMMATLSNVRADNFLKAFWTMKHGRIRSVDLFSAFKKEYSMLLTDGKAGTVENVWLDELHGLRVSIKGHDGKWPVSTVKLSQS